MKPKVILAQDKEDFEKYHIIATAEKEHEVFEAVAMCIYSFLTPYENMIIATEEEEVTGHSMSELLANFLDKCVSAIHNGEIFALITCDMGTTFESGEEKLLMWYIAHSQEFENSVDISIQTIAWFESDTTQKAEVTIKVRV